MNENEILRKISTNLTERKNSAALSNYEVLCNNIKFVNDLFKFVVHSFHGLQFSFKESLREDSLLNNEYKNTSDLHPFISIVPRIISNGLAVADKFTLYTEPDDRSGITTENIALLRRGFLEYNHLVTATRQYIDSIVSDSYQLCLLEPKSFNYHVLISLNSFDKYATKSLSQALFNEEIRDCLDEFGKLRFRDWKRSAITECSHTTFGKKIDFLFSVLGIASPTSLAEEMKDLFKFSSEFTHIGYVSTFFSSSSGAEVIFGDDIGPYLPSTENFGELKYEILETIFKSFIKVYLPSVVKCIEKLLCEDEAKKYATEILKLINQLNDKLKTRNSQYYFFVKSGLIGSRKTIELKCMCGVGRNWKPLHEKSELFCTGCGSSFNILEVEGDGGYIITSNGPAKIIGADVPDFEDLPKEKQIEMLKQIEALNKEKFGN